MRAVRESGHLLLSVCLTSLISLGNHPSPTACGSGGAASHNTSPTSHKAKYVTQVCLITVSHSLGTVTGPEISIRPK